MFRRVLKLTRRYEAPLEGLNEMMKLLGSKGEFIYAGLLTRRIRNIAKFHCAYFSMSINIIPERMTYLKALHTKEVTERKHRFEIITNVPSGSLSTYNANMFYIMNETKSRFKQAPGLEANIWYADDCFHHGIDLLSWKQLWEFMCTLAEVLHEYD